MKLNFLRVVGFVKVIRFNVGIVGWGGSVKYLCFEVIAMVWGVIVVGGSVVGDLFVGGSAVVDSVVGSSVVGCSVLGSFVIGNSVVGSSVVIGSVIVGCVDGCCVISGSVCGVFGIFVVNGDVCGVDGGVCGVAGAVVLAFVCGCAIGGVVEATFGGFVDIIVDDCEGFVVCLIGGGCIVDVSGFDDDVYDVAFIVEICNKFVEFEITVIKLLPSNIVSTTVDNVEGKDVYLINSELFIVEKVT